MREGAALRNANNQNDQQDSGDEGNEDKQVVDVGDSKIGAKKRAKLEAKAEKKAQREADLKMREQRKKQQEKEEAERKLREEQEQLEEKKLEEEQKKLQEEKERKEEEEYQKMKAAFTVEEEGFDEEEEQEGNLLQEFVAHIKEQKVVMLEDVAAKFNLRIQTVISRIEDLLSSGVLTGVIDDRGKFIYITVEELQAVADFVKKRGRVTIQELVENSNNLILLN
ncbi:hypothetical protein V9T40_009431 [Parthenolecanium corni]|uniref:DDRGK domain-containing protein 1 n=1 Tax=Parthenolecanium corni TaxID=536013 RepID=A0AAN9TSH3_9HEMI